MGRQGIKLDKAHAFSSRFLQLCAQEEKALSQWGAIFHRKIKPKSDYPLKTLYPRAFQTGQNHLIYYDFTTVE